MQGAAGGSACAEESCGECPSGAADCNGDPVDGCETLLGSTDNCQACGRACTNPHGSAECVAQTEPPGWACRTTCAAGYADCDLRPENGCETDVNQDVLHCGACGKACPAGGGTPNCIAGKCGVSACNAGFADCRNIGSCEINLLTDRENCGRCGHVCSGEHGAPFCQEGVCGIDCADGFGDCNEGEDANDGCETTLNVRDAEGSVPHCGACNALCKRRAYTIINLEKCAQGECFRDCFEGANDCENERNLEGCLGSGCGCEFKPCD